MRDTTLNGGPIDRAVILAAGFGSRLRSAEQGCPKPLRPVAGVPLLVRVLGSLEAAGVREAVIVLGYEGARIRRALEADDRVTVDLEFVENSRYEAKNGVSVLAARDFVEQGCILSMADHLYSPEIVRRLAESELAPGSCALGVDYDIPRCFDLDDATKVRVRSGKIVAIAKELPDYDALDTGVFRINRALIDELDGVNDRLGDCSLSDGVQALSTSGRFHACDIGDARWVDVDTPDSAEHAADLLARFGDDLGDAESARGLRPSGIWLPSVPELRSVVGSDAE